MDNRLQKANNCVSVQGIERIKGEVIDGEKTYGVSLYRGDVATSEELADAVMSLTAVFPSFSNNAKKAMLIGCLIDERFTLQRARDAIMHVAKTFRYKEPNIADVVSYDRRLKLYTHSECCRMVTRGECTFDDLRTYTKLPSGELLRYKVSEAMEQGLINN